MTFDAFSFLMGSAWEGGDGIHTDSFDEHQIRKDERNKVLDELEQWCEERSKEALAECEPTFNVVSVAYDVMAAKCRELRGEG